MTGFDRRTLSARTHCCRLLLWTLAWTGLLLGTAPVSANQAKAPVSITVEQVSGDHLVLEYRLGAFQTETVDINGKKHAIVSLGEESPFKLAGAPAVPSVNRSVIIPDDAKMAVNVLNATYYELSEMDVAPSKGIIYRPTSPQDVPYTFGAAYANDAFFPGEVAQLHDPYIMRDHRGLVVQLNPFQYNPVTRTLRVYTAVTLEVVAVGPGQINVLYRRPSELSLAFHDLYSLHFLNYTLPARYTPLDESGDMLVIAYDSWMANVQPLANHKTARGINTTVVGISTIGNNSTAIKNYIQGVYDSSDLAFVLLVGDGAQVDTPSASGGSSDPSYAKLAGGDNYPDIMVGRFSAESAADVDTQVDRTITYENLPATAQDWFWRGTGVASNQGPGDDGEYDNQHIDNIRDDLLAYGYTTVDQIYDPSGTAAQVSAALNSGRGIINYCGHGSTTAWSSTGFSNTHVNALTNVNMLPFICSVACVNGQFDGYTCFGEAWLRATHNGEPTGAIAAYMSSINQSWDPPMCAQDEFVDVYVAEAYSSVGTLFYAGSCQMMDEYGSGGVEMYDTWHIFGDPSVKVAMSCVDAGTLSIDSQKYSCEDTVAIQVIDCGLNLDNGVVDTAQVTIESDTEPGGETVTLTEIGPDSGQFEGEATISETNSYGVLQVSEGDLLVVRYIDADDGQGGQWIEVTSTAAVDCTPPEISGVTTLNVEPRSATIGFTTNEPSQGTVRYGEACGALDYVASGSGYDTNPVVGLGGLEDDTTYYYIVQAKDEAGNWADDDNGGACYSFTTPGVPDFFTELFESDNDLGNLSLIFTPDGGNDFYNGCTVLDVTELPTDPAGGSSLSFSPSSDDGAAEVTLTGGETISLYGQTYGSFFVGTNGYLTFDHSETGYTESLEAHFGTPRVCGLFDDLNPGSGGTITYKQLADRVAVTYDGVEEYSSGNVNTFQFELFFDGTITITYLEVNITDGLAGLSDGGGVDPDFWETDLSAMDDCGPKPPTAIGGSVETFWAIPVTIGLEALDDGLPDPPAALNFIITALPEDGTLSDPGAGNIDAVPYTLADYGNQVVYTPDYGYYGQDGFQFKVNDGGIPEEGGGDSNEANIDVTVSLPDAEAIYSFPLDADPGWSVEGGWAFGQPTGGGTHGRDPSNGYTGTNVLGYNLAGDYPNNMTEIEYLTSTAFDCSELVETELRFRRWLGVEQAEFDHANLEISNDGVEWFTVWEHTGTSFSETEWVYKTYDLSSVADGEETVYVRWGMGPTDDGVTYPGWNLDDVEIWAAFSLPPLLDIVASYPPDGAIDACQPIDLGTLEAQGLESVEITFDGAADAVSASKFTLEEVCEAGNCDGVAPLVDSVDTDGSVVTLNLDRPLDPLAWTVITYVDGDEDDVIRLGFLPADADNSKIANANDILAVVDAVTNGGPLYQYDIDRSGTITSNDITVLIDLLNGAGVFEPYSGATLPEIP